MRKEFLATIWRDNLGLYWPEGKLQIISCDFVYDGVWYINMNNVEFPANSATKTLSQVGTNAQHAQVTVREGNVYESSVAYPGPGFKETVRLKDMKSQRTFWVDKTSYDNNVVACNDCCIPVPCLAPAPAVDGVPASTGVTIEITYDGPEVVGFEYVVTPAGGGCVDPTIDGKLSLDKTIGVFDLSPSTEYCFCVRTVCGPDRFSGWVCITFVTAPPPCNEVIPSVDAVTDTTVDIILATFGGATPIGYEYVVTPSGGDPCGIPVGPGTISPGTSISVTGLTPATDYCFAVRTICGSGNSAWTTTPFTTTP